MTPQHFHSSLLLTEPLKLAISPRQTTMRSHCPLFCFGASPKLGYQKNKNMQLQRILTVDYYLSLTYSMFSQFGLKKRLQASLHDVMHGFEQNAINFCLAIPEATVNVLPKFSSSPRAKALHKDFSSKWKQEVELFVKSKYWCTEGGVKLCSISLINYSSIESRNGRSPNKIWTILNHHHQGTLVVSKSHDVKCREAIVSPLCEWLLARFIFWPRQGCRYVNFTKKNGTKRNPMMWSNYSFSSSADLLYSNLGAKSNHNSWSYVVGNCSENALKGPQFSLKRRRENYGKEIARYWSQQHDRLWPHTITYL